MAKTEKKSVGKKFENVFGRWMRVERNSNIGVATCLVADIFEKLTKIEGS